MRWKLTLLTALTLATFVTAQVPFYLSSWDAPPQVVADSMYVQVKYDPLHSKSFKIQSAFAIIDSTAAPLIMRMVGRMTQVPAWTGYVQSSRSSTGWKTLTVISTDTSGYIDTAKRQIYVNHPPSFKWSSPDTNVFVHETARLRASCKDREQSYCEIRFYVNGDVMGTFRDSVDTLVKVRYTSRSRLTVKIATWDSITQGDEVTYTVTGDPSPYLRDTSGITIPPEPSWTTNPRAYQSNGKWTAYVKPNQVGIWKKHADSGEVNISIGKGPGDSVGYLDSTGNLTIYSGGYRWLCIGNEPPYKVNFSDLGRDFVRDGRWFVTWRGGVFIVAKPSEVPVSITKRVKETIPPSHKRLDSFYRLDGRMIPTTTPTE